MKKFISFIVVSLFLVSILSITACINEEQTPTPEFSIYATPSINGLVNNGDGTFYTEIYLDGVTTEEVETATVKVICDCGAVLQELVATKAQIKLANDTYSDGQTTFIGCGIWSDFESDGFWSFVGGINKIGSIAGVEWGIKTIYGNIKTLTINL